MGRFAQARVGYAYDARKVAVDIGTSLLPEISPRDAGITVSGEYDSRDTAFSPTHGLAAALEYMASDDALGGDRNWQRAELGVGVAVPLRRDVLWVTAAGGTGINGNLPPDRAFTLGGPGSFPGLELGELRVGGYWTMGTSYLWNFKDVLPIRNLALYAGIQLVGGAVYDRNDGEPSEGIYGGSVFLTGRTMVGPLTVGIGATSTDSWSIWFSVGRPVGHGTILERGIFR
jgi:outer membrane translocation and assembly module TamA